MTALHEAAAELVRSESIGHLGIDAIAAYHAGELDQDAEARARRHLVACAECGGLLVDLERLSNGELGSGGASEIEVAYAWRGLARRLPATSSSPGTSSSPAAGRWPWALAASLLAAVLGLSLWVGSLRGTLDELSQPQLNTPIADFLPGELRGDDGGVTTLSLGPDDRFFTLVLNPPPTPDTDDFAVEIRSSGGELVWRGEGLRKNALGSLDMTLARRFLADGEYRIELYPSGQTGGSPVAELTLAVESRPTED